MPLVVSRPKFMREMSICVTLPGSPAANVESCRRPARTTRSGKGLRSRDERRLQQRDAILPS
jgi:hypothetical protein